MVVAKKKIQSKNKKNNEDIDKSTSSLINSLKLIICILLLSSLPVILYNPNYSLGPLDAFRTDFFKTEIILSGEGYNADSLVRAIRTSNTRTVKLFIRSGFNLNELDSQGNLPLCVAAETGNYEIFNLLMKGNVNFVKSNLSNGMSPIFCAIKGNNIQIINKLISAGISVNSKNESAGGISPAHYAAALGRDNILTHLINMGANVNAINLDGETPLHMAVSQKNIVVLYMLLNSGANVNAENHEGETPLSIA